MSETPLSKFKALIDQIAEAKTKQEVRTLKEKAIQEARRLRLAYIPNRQKK